MEYFGEENRAHLSGRILTAPFFSHKTYGEAFYLMMLGAFRKSGCEDRIRLIVSERILGGRSPQEGDLVDLYGQIRTYNREANGKNHLEINVFVRELYYWGEEHPDGVFNGYGSFSYCNEISLEGFLCKVPVRRTSPLGREICDLMLAVNRQYNKSDYIPAIAWGRNAVYAATLAVGEKIFAEGRLQSREYRKYSDDGIAEIRTAYEVSIGRLERVE